MLEIILGRPRSGKTHRIITEIQESVKQKRKTYLIVPDQQIFVSESILARLDPEVWQYLEVVSFTGLCELVFGKHGGLTYKRVSDGAKHLLAWFSTKRISEFLVEFDSVKIDPAFSDMALLTIDELAMMGISPERLEEVISKSDNEAFVTKMRDICLIYSSYLDLVEKKMGNDVKLSDKILTLLYETIHKNSFFSTAHVYIDSFTDFTGLEWNIVKSIILSADKTAITLPIATRGAHDNYTESAKRTLKSLTSFARDNYIESVDILCDSQNEYIYSDLCHLEKNLWNFKLLPSENNFSHPIDNISMAICKNPYDEAEYIALKILEYKNKGYKYSDMAVIPRDAESKKGIINAIFDKYSIPYFYSEKTDLSNTSCARLVLSALKCISHNFRLDDILTLVKTGLCPIEPYKCDMFEDYCTTWNICGNMFYEDVWSMNPDGYSTRVSERGKEILDAANEVKNIIMPPLISLASDIRAAEKNTKKICMAIYSYLENMSIADNLTSLCELELSLGNTREASEILRMYDYMISSLTELSVILGEECMGVDDISSAISILLSHTDIGSVPSSFDYVTVGSASTLRAENIKIAFVPGLVEGEFPANVNANGIIKDNDKELLSAIGIKLPSTEEKLASDELTFSHRAISTPHDKLILTTYTNDLGGHSKTPSMIWTRALYVLPALKAHVEQFDIERIKLIAKEKLKNYMADNTREDCESTPTKEIPTDMLSTFGDDSFESIDPSLARLVFGDSIYLSKSAISTFLLCPYRYWCENVLKIRENKGGLMNAADIGTYVHFVLEKLIAKEKLDDGSLPKLTSKELLERINKVSEDYIDTIGFVPSPSMLYAISRYRNIAHAMLVSIFEEFSNSQFKIIGMEQSLSERKQGALSPLKFDIDLPDDFKSKIVLMGEIDRLDAYKNQNGIYLRIVDYKTGTNTFDINKVSEGNELQLPIYLFSAASEENKFNPIFKNEEGKELYPASAMFLSAKESNGTVKPLRSGFIANDNEILKATSNTLDSEILGVKIDKDSGKAVGNAVSFEEMAGLKKTLIDTISDVAKNLYSGKAERCPSQDACKYCKVRNTCPVAAKIKEY